MTDTEARRPRNPPTDRRSAYLQAALAARKTVRNAVLFSEIREGLLQKQAHHAPIIQSLSNEEFTTLLSLKPIYDEQAHSAHPYALNSVECWINDYAERCLQEATSKMVQNPGTVEEINPVFSHYESLQTQPQPPTWQGPVAKIVDAAIEEKLSLLPQPPTPSR